MRKHALLLMIFFFFAPSLRTAALSAVEKMEARPCALSDKTCMHGDRCPLKEAARKRTALTSGQGRSGVKASGNGVHCRQCYRCCEPGDAYDLTRVKKASLIKDPAGLSRDGVSLPAVEFEQDAYNEPAIPVIERPPASTPIV